MLNNTIILKVKNRVNKLDSQDYENVPVWQILEAFNKGQTEWCRRNLHGANQFQEGDEQSTSRIEDLQVLITPLDLTFTDKGIYFESTSTWPINFLREKRISLEAVNDCCEEAQRITVYLAEEGNVDQCLDDVNVRPDFRWRQTFYTVAGNTIHLYHNGEFTVNKCTLIYYRIPRRINKIGVVDIYSGIAATVEVECELKDDLIELIIDEAASILAGDMESQQFSRESQQVEKNN